VHVGHKVLIEVEVNSALIVGDLQGILRLQVRPQLVNLVNNIMMLVTFEGMGVIMAMRCPICQIKLLSFNHDSHVLTLSGRSG
jgi:hypothetical protein